VFVSLCILHEYLDVNLAADIVDRINQSQKPANYARWRRKPQHEIEVWMHVREPANQPGMHESLAEKCRKLKRTMAWANRRPENS
jgi:hypothetical protein